MSMQGYTPAVSPATHKWSLIPLTLALLLGFAVRLWQLDSRALWFDEGISLTFADMPLADYVHFSNLWQDTNPPAYKASLGLWLIVVGWSPLTTRLFSVIAGIFGVALTARLARVLGGKRSAIILSGVFMALAPMQVYYSREAKGYTFEQLFLLIVLIFWMRVIVLQKSMKSRWKWGEWVALTLSTTLAIGTHYMAAPLLLTINMVAIIILIRRMRKVDNRQPILSQAAFWLASQLIAAVAWIPWVLSTSRTAIAGTSTAATDGSLAARDPLTYLSEMLLEFAAGPTGDLVGRTVVAVVVVIGATVGITRIRNPRVRLIALCIFGVPLLMGYGIQIAAPFFFPRFLLYLVPLMLVLLAFSAADIRSPIIRLGSSGLGIVLMSVLVLAQYRLASPVPDLRPLADAIAGQSKPGDALISSYSWQPGMMAAYLGDRADLISYTSFFDDLETELADILDRHQRVWLLTYQISASDPINDVGNWLLTHAASPEPVRVEGSQVRLFVSPSAASNAGAAQECWTFDTERIELCFAPLESDAVDDPLILAFTWRTREQLAERYVTFVHVLSEESPVPVAQQDIEPGNRLLPTFSWEPNSEILDSHAVTLPPDMSGGRYSVWVGLYDADTLERVPVDGGGDSVQVGEFDYEAEGK